MPRYDFRAVRLYVELPLERQEHIPLNRTQANYLFNVLRLQPGAVVLVFNGSDGEWRALLAGQPKKPELVVTEQTRDQTTPPDLHYLFAPLKHARLDYMVQKAVEMGVSRLQPVFTHHTQVTRVNLGRMHANAVEAAEQCGILSLPEIAEPMPLARAVEGFPSDRLLVFCDEEADIRDPIAALAQARPHDGRALPLAVLIGPEGGFSDDERRLLLSMPKVVRLSLGTRILRADTAAVAALSLVGAVLGDWC
jgi:16S rRNA (uracil1498-N3)-methyltransferase